MKLQKSLYVGLSALMIASVGGLSQGNNINAKRRTKVVRITHLKKWQHNKLNHAKYLRNKNNRKINSIKHYLKYHKRGRYTKNQRKLLNRLNKQNKNLNTQIYEFNFKKVTIKAKRHNRNDQKKSYTHIDFDQFYKDLNKGVSLYDNSSSQRAVRNLIKSHVIVSVNGQNIAINRPKDISTAIFAHNKERAEQNAQQTQSENDYAQNEINNSMGGSNTQDQGPSNIQNADAIYQKAYNDTESQYQQANNNLNNIYSQYQNDLRNE